MSETTESVLPKLIAAVNLMMDPNTPHQMRLDAYRACEDFKENSPVCVQCGAEMASRDKPPIIRHFGLQLMEHCVKYRWYNLDVKEKLFIRNHTMELMSSGTLDMLTEQLHIKDVLSRVVVEMMKREWPQHWPTLMQELDTLCKLGPTQTELVLLVFLRLSEDVVAFQTVPTQRRREMLQALTSSIPDLFIFFCNALQENTKLYQEKKGSNDEGLQREAQVHCKLAHAVLTTLAAYVDWVPMNHITNNNSSLLRLLCLLLQEDQLQLPAAECLLLITGRKGKVEDRKPLLVLFTEEAMGIILAAAQHASNAETSEYYFLFLKRLCQVLTSVGSQLCTLWGPEYEVQQPPNFATFLEALVAFMQHPGQMLGSLIQCLWASFLRHEHIKCDPVLHTYLPQLTQACSRALFKVGFPSQDSHPSCVYSRMDFDCDEDFNLFFSRYRAEVADTVRLVTLLRPLVTFQFVADWLRQMLAKPIENNQGEHCSLSSPAFLEWDALSVFLESVMSRLSSAAEPKPAIADGISLLQAVLAYQTSDPLILSALLSCISALFPYIRDAPDTLPMVVDKPGFEQLYSHIRKLSSDPTELSQMEKLNLMESLVLISNGFKKFDKQCSFLGEVLAPIKEIWLSGDVKDVLWSTPKFLTYIGVDQAPVEPSEADTCGINRSHISYCVGTIIAVMKRSNWPADMQEAMCGGFVSQTETGDTYFRNPCMPHLGALLDNVLALIRTMNGQWSPEFLSKRHSDFVKAYEMMETDRLSVLGIHPPLVDDWSSSGHKSPIERMKNFLCTTHDTCCHILGNAGQCLGREFYAAPALSTSILNSVFTNLENIPDYRLRPIIRYFLKPHIYSCPKDLYEQAVVPLLAAFGPFMLQRLTEKWQLLNQRCAEGLAEDEDAYSQEILEEQLTRLLTRDYLDMVGAIFRSSKASNGASAAAADELEDLMMEDVKPPPQAAEDGFSDLGNMLLKSQTIFAPFVLCVFSGLTWLDTMVCNKCVYLALPLAKQLLADKGLSSEDSCHLFTMVLYGLELQGQHEGLQSALLSLGLQLYELLVKPALTHSVLSPEYSGKPKSMTFLLVPCRHSSPGHQQKPEFPEVRNIMLQVANSSEEKLKSLDDKLFPSSPQKPLTDKKKKEHFKRYIQDIIGKSLGEQFKRETKIRNLPPLMKLARRKQVNLEDSEKADIGLCALFGPDCKTEPTGC